jgi:uncharacterized protein
MNKANIAVNVESSCTKKGCDKPFMLIVEKGKRLIEAIIQCADSSQINSASLYGIGALMNPELGFFDINSQAYQYKKFDGFFELVSLSGNITKLDGKNVAHIHVVLSDRNYQVIAGHLKDAEVGVTAEISITPFAGTVVRRNNPEFNVNLIVAE